MVSGGGISAYNSVEVLFANGTSYCTLPDVSKYRYYHTQDGLTACGGDGNIRDNCVTLTDGQWTQSHTLLHDRHYHTSWSLGDERVMLMGGYYSGNTTEIVSPGSSSTSEGFTLKYNTRYSYYYYTGCPKKNAPILLESVEKWGRFFWDTLYNQNILLHPQNCSQTQRSW